jgi:hypothetical protein
MAASVPFRGFPQILDPSPGGSAGAKAVLRTDHMVIIPIRSPFTERSTNNYG